MFHIVLSSDPFLYEPEPYLLKLLVTLNLIMRYHFIFNAQGPFSGRTCFGFILSIARRRRRYLVYSLHIHALIGVP